MKWLPLAFLLALLPSVPAQNLFVANEYGNDIIEFTPGGVQSTFASGLGIPYAVAFDSANNLLVANWASANVIKITPGGVQSTFASESL